MSDSVKKYYENAKKNNEIVIPRISYEYERNNCRLQKLIDDVFALEEEVDYFISKEKYEMYEMAKKKIEVKLSIISALK